LILEAAWWRVSSTYAWFQESGSDRLSCAASIRWNSCSIICFLQSRTRINSFDCGIIALHS
jgi:hypothetical protein